MEGIQLEGTEVEAKRFLNANEVAEIFRVSQATGYRIVKRLNNELEQQGKIIFPGRISRRYFEERAYI